MQTVEYVTVGFCHHQCTYKYYNYEGKAIRRQRLRTQFKILLHSTEFLEVYNRLFSGNAKSLAGLFLVQMGAQDILVQLHVLKRGHGRK